MWPPLAIRNLNKNRLCSKTCGIEKMVKKIIKNKSSQEVRRLFTKKISTGFNSTKSLLESNYSTPPEEKSELRATDPTLKRICSEGLIESWSDDFFRSPHPNNNTCLSRTSGFAAGKNQLTYSLFLVSDTKISKMCSFFSRNCLRRQLLNKLSFKGVTFWTFV